MPGGLKSLGIQQIESHARIYLDTYFGISASAWNSLEQLGTAWNSFEQLGTAWNRLEQLAQTPIEALSICVCAIALLSERD